MIIYKVGALIFTFADFGVCRYVGAGLVWFYGQDFVVSKVTVMNSLFG
jgi:hypothetical protein